MKGAFQISREIFDNPIWNDIPKFRIFFYIVGNAVFSEGGVRKGNVHIGRGQFLRSYRNISDDLEYIENRKIKKYSISVISRKIDQLVKEERLKIEDTELGTLFTVVNYNEYQGLENYKKKRGTALEQSGNSDGTALEQSRNNNKNVKNAKNEKKYSPKQVYDESSLYYRLANYFLGEIRKNNPDHKTPNMQTWSDDIRKMMELDNRNEEQIRYLMRWVQADDFEMANVLSPNKLRKRFDQLVIKVKSEKRPATVKPIELEKPKSQLRHEQEMRELGLYK